MRNIFIAAGLAALAMTTSAVASDLPVRDYSNRFDGWYVSVFASNPLNTFKADHATNPVSSHKLTGSLAGAALGRTFQHGNFVFGGEVSLAGGVIEGQSDGASCPNNCRTELNGLGEATLLGGYAWDRLLLYVGGGPTFAVMRSGQTVTGLHTELVSGVHVKGGAKFAFNRNWAMFAEGELQRLGDLAYNTPGGHVGINVKDHKQVRLGLTYSFNSL